MGLEPRKMTPEARLREIAAIIEAVDDRCAAADGPVTSTLREMTQAEISRIYKLADAPNGRKLGRSKTEDAVLYPVLSVNGDAMQWMEPLWNAIHSYTRHCGGDPGKPSSGLAVLDHRIDDATAVHDAVESAIRMAYRASRTPGSPDEP